MCTFLQTESQKLVHVYYKARFVHQHVLSNVFHCEKFQFLSMIGQTTKLDY